LFERTCVFIVIQWKAFHRVRLCGNERIGPSELKSDLHAANLCPALEEGWGKKTPSASILFFVRIWNVFVLSKCRGVSDSCLCMRLVLAKRMPLRSADFWFQDVFGHRIRWKSALRNSIFFASTKLMYRPRSDSSLHFNIKNICQNRAEPAQPNFFQKIELSRLNPIFFWKFWVEPAQLDVFKRPKIAPKSPLRLFFQIWVEPAQPTFPKFVFSLHRLRLNPKKEAKNGFWWTFH